jgi:hypothetical protein
MQDYLLPSDSLLRADMGPLKAHDYTEAEKQKSVLEEAQRKDKKMRQTSAKERPAQTK